MYMFQQKTKNAQWCNKHGQVVLYFASQVSENMSIKNIEIQAVIRQMQFVVFNI